jgi:quercetin dioxygenase-like cupin family protein
MGTRPRLDPAWSRGGGAVRRSEQGRPVCAAAEAAAGYRIAPHSHPKPEVVTVISGTFRLGMGETADQGNAEPLAAGSFFAMAPGMAHYAYTDEETVVQVNSTGPWGLTYVNPEDDPRQKTQ